MSTLDGRKRVVISNVRPQIEEGRFPARRAIGESVVFSADIIADGHDAVAASVIFRYGSDQLWHDIPMSHAGNDRWHARWTPGKEGFYEYRFTGWVDHFTAWKKGLLKKFDANQDIGIELRDRS